MCNDNSATKDRFYLTECNDPERCWRHEFTKWCIEFEKYQEQMKQWRCLKV